MGRAVLLACLPWLGWLILSAAVLFLLAGASRARLEAGRLRQLHADQRGSAQSLSFVLTLPLFVMILLLIVQVSQLMIGTVVVHYAAYAAAARRPCGFRPICRARIFGKGRTASAPIPSTRRRQRPATG